MSKPYSPVESGTVTTPDIVRLEQLVGALPPDTRQVFGRLYHTATTTGQLSPPPSMQRWIERYFGDVGAVASQQIVRITNRHTLEGSLFNALRASRPIEHRVPVQLDDEIARTEGGPFSEPLNGTPADTFGRIRGRHCITASNVAKYDGLHGLIIFDNHHPLDFNADDIADYLDVGRQWAARANATDPAAIYYFFMWNCLWRSGASIPHGHAQVSLARSMHYARVEAYRRAVVGYRTATGSGYMDDLWRAHEALGLGHTLHGCRALVHLTPVKEKELLIVSSGDPGQFARAIHDALRCYIDQLGVVSFNLVVYQPPLTTVGVVEDWSDFPVMARIVDRGDPVNRTSDIGSMELYASSVIASDPFRVAAALRGTARLTAD